LGLYCLGHMYANGQGVEADVEKGIQFATAAANANVFDSCILLGDIYFLEEYGVQNMDKAIEFYLLALKIKETDRISPLRIGRVFDYLGDDEKTLEWLVKAANAGSLAALFNLGRYASENRPFFGGKEKALHWFEKGAAQNCEDCTFAAAVLHLEAGKNVEKGSQMLRRAADLGSHQAVEMVTKLNIG